MAAETIIERNQNLAGNYSGGSTKTLFSINEENTVDMGVADGALSIILEMLSDVSSNPGAYMLREAYSNALDAVRVTGDMTRRIDIIVPIDELEGMAAKIYLSNTKRMSTNCPVVIVKDEGCGMSPEDVRGFFLQYGGSKKRGDAESIGSKGLGSKAPLAVSDTFEVTTVKDGEKTHAIISKNLDKNTATITVTKTDEPNGTCVRVPVSNSMVLHQAYDCAKKLGEWNIGANLYINGRKADGIHANKNLQKVGDVKIGIDSDGNDLRFPVYYVGCGIPTHVDTMTSQGCKFTIAIGGFPYELTSGSGSRYWGCDQYVVIGDPGYLNFTPSRDEIKNDDASQRFFYALCNGIKAHGFDELVSNVLVNSSKNAKKFVDFFCSARNIADNGDGTVKVAFDGFDAAVPRDMFIIDGHDMLGLAMRTVAYRNRFSNNANNALVSEAEKHIDTKGIEVRCVEVDNSTKAKRDYRIIGNDKIACYDVYNADLIGIHVSQLLSFRFMVSTTRACVVSRSRGKNIGSIWRNISAAQEDILGREHQRGDTIIFIFADEEADFDDFEKSVLAGCFVDVVYRTFDELTANIAVIKRSRANERAKHKSNKSASCFAYDFSKYGGTPDGITEITKRNGSFMTTDDLDDDDVKGNLFAIIGATKYDSPSIPAALCYALGRRSDQGWHADGCVILCAPTKDIIIDLEKRGARFVCDLRRGKLYSPSNMATEDSNVNLKFNLKERTSYDVRGYYGHELVISTVLALTDNEVADYALTYPSYYDMRYRLSGDAVLANRAFIAAVADSPLRAAIEDVIIGADENEVHELKRLNGVSFTTSNDTRTSWETDNYKLVIAARDTLSEFGFYNLRIEYGISDTLHDQIIDLAAKNILSNARFRRDAKLKIVA